MSQNEQHDRIDEMEEERERLRRENEELSRQIRRLVRAESKLYAFQEQLDARIREYKGLYELNTRLIGASSIPEMLSCCCDYVINSLEYERVLLLTHDNDGALYRTCVCDGYYDPAEQERVAGLAIAHDAPLAPLLQGKSEYLICTPESSEGELAPYRQLFAMNQYLIYPLARRDQFPAALIVIGNSRENAEFYHPVAHDEGSLLGIGNLVGLLSSSLENRILYEEMDSALSRARLAEARYRNIFESASEGIFQVSMSGTIMNCNPAAAVILGYESPRDLMENLHEVGKRLFVLPEQRTKLIGLLRRKGGVSNFEVELFRKDGSRQWTLLSLQPTRDAKGETTCLSGIMLDIAERKRANDLVISSLHEKETLLREIHHRVKNNLQIISTLLDLQSDSLPDDRTQELFRECQNRIKTIALVHEKLYKTVDFVSINLAEYLESMVRYLFSMYLPDDGVSLEFEADDTGVGIDEAIPCGLIVNELVTNALKYAFPDGRSGEVRLAIRRDRDGMISLTVGDNGVGLAADFDYRNTETLGLQLVTLLVRQLRGTLERHEAPGTLFSIRFPHQRSAG